MDKKEVLIFLLNEFADWEYAFIAPLLHAGLEPGRAKYTVKTLSVTKQPVTSIGNFNVIPDYDLNTMPDNFAGLLLIGGMQWFSNEAKQIVPIVKKAIENNKVVGGICNASVFLGMNGFLNNIKHTSNTLEYLKQYAGETYTGDNNYINEQAVRDGNIVTANGTGYLEFCKETLYALNADTPEEIDRNYNFYKLGWCEMMKNNSK